MSREGSNHMAVKFDEISPLKQVAIRPVAAALESPEKMESQWQKLRFHACPDYVKALEEYEKFASILVENGTDLITLGRHDDLTLDSIYTRDSLLVTPKGLIRLTMGRESRRAEAALNAAALASHGYDVIGDIVAPGCVEGGDFIWLNEKAAAVGLGPRTNQAGVDQLRVLLGEGVDLHVVPLPDPDHPDDVLHLMSIISPLDHDLALVYMPFMPPSFVNWLAGYGVKCIPLPETDYLTMGCNVLALAPRQVLMLEGLPDTKTALEAAGCRVQTYKGTEISRKGEGGPTCLTRPLRRE